jgi:hypothetical protein
MKIKHTLLITSIAIAVLVTGFCFGAIWSTAFLKEATVHKQGYSPKGNKIEYYLELDHDSAIVESSHGRVYRCHHDSISEVLNRDNL